MPAVDDDSPIRLPERPAPGPARTQTAPQKTDGSVVPDGPGRIADREIVAPSRWYAAADFESLRAAAGPLLALDPPCGSLAAAVPGMLMERQLDPPGKYDSTPMMLLLVHPPGALVGRLGRALAAALFRDPDACLSVDCARPENGAYGLFGAPPGYSGCLEGGAVANQLVRRPESVIVLDNIEYADGRTVETLRRARIRPQGTRWVAQGADARYVETTHAVFVVGTARGFGAVVSAPEAGTGRRDRVVASLKKGRPDLDWTCYDPVFASSRLFVWA